MTTTKDNQSQKKASTVKRKKDAKPSPAAGKVEGKKNSIDSIFADKKKQKKEEATAREIARKKKPKQESSSNGNNKAGNLSVLEREFGPAGTSSKKWIDDGLGGKFNQEGYTGRVEDGVKVFKAHTLNKPNFGTSKDCPFDCQCCFI